MQSKADAAFEYIKQKIILGEYAPLSPILENSLQKELNTSRTPVREAILRLRNLGFVYNYPNVGNVVSEISLDLINEIYTARYVNEPVVNVGASKCVNRKFLEELRCSFLNPPEDLKGESLAAYMIRLDDELHEGLLNVYPNRFIQDILHTVFDHNRRLRRFSEKISVTEHVNIIDAVLSGDEERIRQTTIEHLNGSKELTLEAYISGKLKKL